MSKITLHEQSVTPSTPDTNKQSLYVKSDGVYTVDDTGTEVKIGPSTGSMVYPAAGIALSTGSAWSSSIADNSSNWNTAFGWGNHASAGYEVTSNKSTNTSLGTSDTLYPSQKAVKTYVDTGLGTKQNTITTGTTGQYFRGDLSLATFPTNVSSFSNDAGYITATNISGCNLYDLADVGATSPSPGHFLGWSGTAWDAITPSLGCLSGVSITSPTTGQVLKYNGSIWVNDTDMTGGGGLNVGTCKEIPYVDAAGTDFCYVSGFNFNPTAYELEVWSCGVVDPAYNCHISRSGVIDTYFKSDGMSASCIFQVGFYDGECPHWGIRSCPSATAYTVNQYLDFTDYCTKWGNDDAYWLIGDTDNSMLGKFMCGLEISHTSSSWSIDYCSMEPNRIRINKSWYLPECGPTAGQWLGYCSMTGQPEWMVGGSGAASCGSCTWIQMSDGMGGFAANCNFIYDYSFNYLQMRGNATCELLKLDHRSAGGGWVLDVTNDTCGLGCDLIVRLGNDGMSNYRSMIIDYYCTPTQYFAEINPFERMLRFCYSDGMSCCYFSEFGFDSSNNATVMRNCCFGKYEIGECGIDRMKWTFATYNDFMKLEDCIVSYGGCCNFQFLINNGCTNGYNEWVGDNGLGLVISSSSSCCLHPFIFAQGLVERARFDSSGMFVVCADMNINGSALCIQGNTAFTGTFDTATNTQITIVCGIITGIV